MVSNLTVVIPTHNRKDVLLSFWGPTAPKPPRERFSKFLLPTMDQRMEQLKLFCSRGLTASCRFGTSGKNAGGRPLLATAAFTSRVETLSFLPTTTSYRARLLSPNTSRGIKSIRSLRCRPWMRPVVAGG